MKEISKVKAYLNESLETIISEYNILKNIHNSFIANLYYAFQDRDNIFFLLDYLPGGNLRYYITNKTKFNEEQVRFIISNIILSVEYIHKCNIIHRDLKPENLLFDSKGYIHVTDFGISKLLEDGNIINDLSGTPGYISPEVIMNKPQNKTSDFFSIGIITYELIFGERPFVGRDKNEIAENMMKKIIKLDENDLPKDFSGDAADFINGLLQKKSNYRLGSRGIDEIKNHLWMLDLDWTAIEYQNLDIKTIPFKPTFKEKENQEIIEEYDDNTKINKYNIILEKINREHYFNNFYFNYNEIRKRKEKQFIDNIDKYDESSDEDNK